jgi:hypothetical protein
VPGEDRKPWLLEAHLRAHRAHATGKTGQAPQFLARVAALLRRVRKEALTRSCDPRTGGEPGSIAARRLKPATLHHAAHRRHAYCVAPPEAGAEAPGTAAHPYHTW